MGTGGKEGPGLGAVDGLVDLACVATLAGFGRGSGTDWPRICLQYMLVGSGLSPDGKTGRLATLDGRNQLN